MRKIFALYIFSFVIAGQISAQTLVATFPNLTMLYFNFGETRSVGFENSEYLIGYQGTNLSLVSASTYSVEYTYSLPEFYNSNILLNDINGNGHPEVIINTWVTDNSSSETVYSGSVSIVDMESNQIIFTHESDTSWLQPSVFLSPAGIWHLLISVYILPSGATGSWIYDLNLSASMTDIAQFNQQQSSPHSLSNYPNPFNSSTIIEYSLETQGPVDIIIYDNLGRVVNSIHQPTMAPGAHEYPWNGLDNFGRKTASGIYHVKVISESSYSKKAILLVK